MKNLPFLKILKLALLGLETSVIDINVLSIYLYFLPRSYYKVYIFYCVSFHVFQCVSVCLCVSAPLCLSAFVSFSVCVSVCVSM